MVPLAASIAMSGVVKAWMENETLITRASSARVALVDGKGIRRRHVLENAKVISPIIALFGLRPTVDMIEEHVALFFEMARPKGKPRATRSLVAIGIYIYIYIHAVIYFFQVEATSY